MRRLILLMAAIGATMLVVSGVAYALSVQCDGAGDQDPDPHECQGTEQNDVITGTALRGTILALGSPDVVNARGGDDTVDGGRGADDISGGVGGDGLYGGGGPDDIHGGAGTSDDIEPTNIVSCSIQDEEAGLDASIQGTQFMFGGDGNDDLAGGRDNDALLGDDGRNDLSGNGGDDCLLPGSDANERVSGGDGDDILFVANLDAEDIFCGAGDNDTVDADAVDRVAADCEHVRRPPPLQAVGATPVAEVTITTPEGTITITP